MKEFYDSLGISSVLLQCCIVQIRLLTLNAKDFFCTACLISCCCDTLRGLNLVEEHLEQMGYLEDALPYRQYGCSTVKEFDWPLFPDFDNPNE
jgi:hypothetical protein